MISRGGEKLNKFPCPFLLHSVIGNDQLLREDVEFRVGGEDKFANRSSHSQSDDFNNNFFSSFLTAT